MQNMMKLILGDCRCLKVCNNIFQAQKHNEFIQKNVYYFLLHTFRHLKLYIKMISKPQWFVRHPHIICSVQHIFPSTALSPALFRIIFKDSHVFIDFFPTLFPSVHKLVRRLSGA